MARASGYICSTFDKNIEQICRLTIYASQRSSYPFPFGNSYHMPVLLLVYHRFHFSFVFAWPLIGLVCSPGRCCCSACPLPKGYIHVRTASTHGISLRNIRLCFSLVWLFLRAVWSGPRFFFFIVLLKFKINILHSWKWWHCVLRVSV